MTDTANTPANIDANFGPSEAARARSPTPGAPETSEEAIARPGSSDAAVVELPRKPGRPRGLPKPKNSGRKRGTRNRVTKEIAEIAQKHGKKIVEGLVAEFNDTIDPNVKVKIATLVLAYGYGRPTEHVRSDNVNVNADVGEVEFDKPSQREVARRLALIFTNGAREADEIAGASGHDYGRNSR